MSQLSSRTTKVAGVATLTGIMVAVAIVAITRPGNRQSIRLPAVRAEVPPTRLARELDRCSTLTKPDSACEAVWAENRRRFFGHTESGGIAP